MEKARAEDWLTEISMGTWRYLAKQLGHTTKWATKKYEEIEEENRELTPIELDRLWKKALEEVRPYGTQALLKQHSRLVHYQKSRACVEITSMPLLKMVSQKKENVKRALHGVGSFAAVVELKVKERTEQAIEP
jgi:hypothetical protein